MQFDIVIKRDDWYLRDRPEINATLAQAWDTGYKIQQKAK